MKKITSWIPFIFLALLGVFVVMIWKPLSAAISSLFKGTASLSQAVGSVATAAGTAVSGVVSTISDSTGLTTSDLEAMVANPPITSYWNGGWKDSSAVPGTVSTQSYTWYQTWIAAVQGCFSLFNTTIAADVAAQFAKCPTQADFSQMCQFYQADNGVTLGYYLTHGVLSLQDSDLTLCDNVIKGLTPYVTF